MKSLYKITLTSGSVHHFWLEESICDVLCTINDERWMGNEKEVVKCSEIEAVEVEGTEEDW